jgi:hypothetical protein
MPDGLDSMMAKVGSRATRPPKVPVTPSLHPRTWSGQSPASPQSEEISALSEAPLSTSAHERISPKAQAPIPSGRPVRVARLPVTAEQDLWLRTVCASALADGTRLSEATVLRLALDRLRDAGATWPELRTALLTEPRTRVRRR